MPYSSGRIVHDADAHIMETPTWLRDHADPGLRDQIEPLAYPGGSELRQTGDPDEQRRDLDAAFEALTRRHASDEYRAVEAAKGGGGLSPRDSRHESLSPRLPLPLESHVRTRK